MDDLTVKVEVEIHGTYLREPPPMRVRVVEIPANKITPRMSLDEVLDLTFHYGQNDFQPQRCPSVSVGDVIRWGERRFRVEPAGFERVS